MTSTTPRREPYIAVNCDGTYDAFVPGRGFAANRRLGEALKFIRDNTGRTTGAIRCLDRSTGEWIFEMDIAVNRQ